MEMTDRFHQEIACLATQTYEQSVLKNGKPQKGKEWTLLAAILLERKDKDNETGKVTPNYSQIYRGVFF